MYTCTCTCTQNIHVYTNNYIHCIYATYIHTYIHTYNMYIHNYVHTYSIQMESEVNIDVLRGLNPHVTTAIMCLDRVFPSQRISEVTE